MARVNVIREILIWSSDRPWWQRDALRRLVTQSQLKDTDIAELAEFCKTSHGLANKDKAEPLAARHLPQPRGDSTSVSLTALTHLSGVNALAQDQTIEFGASLTIVYGANAAGKSGYTRILKRACRARGAEEILGNVVSGGVPGRPSATIKYKIEGEDQPPYQWDDDNPPHRDLSRVSVFDRHCASVYIAEQTDVAYRPLGLDLFDRLSDACESVRQVLERGRKELEARELHLPKVAEGTEVHELISRLTSLTNAETVRQLASLSDEETSHFADLGKRLRELHSDDPHKTARALDIRAKRVDALAGRIQDISRLLSDAAVAAVFAARDRMNDARKAAEEMRRSTFEQQPLPNTGSAHGVLFGLLRSDSRPRTHIQTTNSQ